VLGISEAEQRLASSSMPLKFGARRLAVATFGLDRLVMLMIAQSIRRGAFENPERSLCDDAGPRRWITNRCTAYSPARLAVRPNKPVKAGFPDFAYQRRRRDANSTPYNLCNEMGGLWLVIQMGQYQAPQGRSGHSAVKSSRSFIELTVMTKHGGSVPQIIRALPFG
jgi:hypothetical protein